MSILLLLSGCIAPGNTTSVIHSAPENTPVFPSATISPAEIERYTEPGINLTVNSAQVVPSIDGISPNDGVWLIIDLSIQNCNVPDGFDVTRNDIVLSDPETGRNYSPALHPLHLVDPWVYGNIGFTTTKRGEIPFNTVNSQGSYILVLNHHDQTPLLQTVINASRTHEYWHASDTTKELTDSNNFTAVVDQLTTPEKTLEYMGDHFKILYHDGLYSYSPEEFFSITRGDCKDYATFFSYVLAKHGYYAEIVSITYGDGGHSVSIFRDDDGQLKYFSSDKMNGFRNVSSVQDLLRSEMKRSGHVSLLRYKVLPAGSVNMCSMPSGEC